MAKRGLDTEGFEDMELTCADREHPQGEDRMFVWEKGEQAFMNQLASEGKLDGELTPPKRCKACRNRRRQERNQRELRGNEE